MRVFVAMSYGMGLLLAASPAFAQSVPTSAPAKQERPQDERDQEQPTLESQDFLERLGLGRLTGFVRTRAAVRLHDRTVSADQVSDKYDLAQQENTLWVEYTQEKPFRVDWLDVKLLGRAIYDSAFSVNKDVDVDEARNELEFEPELREAYATATFGPFSLRAGRQIVVWGESDIFRVNDWANPVDMRRGFFGDLEEVREPLWMLSSRLSGMDWGLEIVWNPGDFQEELTAPEGAEFYPSEAYAQLRANSYAKLSAAVRAQVLAATPVPLQGLVPNPIFPESNLFLRTDEDKPNHQLRNSEFGVRYRRQVGDWDLSWMYFSTIADRPSLSTKSMTFDPGPPAPPFPGAFTAADNTMTVVTDVEWKRLNVLGFSFNKDIDSIILRGELGASVWETFTQRTASGLDRVDRNALRWVVGIDWPTFLPLLAENRTATLSFQIYQQYIHGATSKELVEVPFQDDIEELETAFSVIAQFAYFEDRLRPSIVYTRDLKTAQLISAKIEYQATNNWRAAVGATFFDGPTHHGFGAFDERDQYSLSFSYLF